MLRFLRGVSEPVALRPLQFDQGELTSTVLRPIGTADQEMTLELMGADPAGVLRALSVQDVTVSGA